MGDFDAEAFRARLTSLREQRYPIDEEGLQRSRERAAIQVGMSTANLINLESHQLPRADTLHKLCVGYGVSADWLLGLPKAASAPGEAGDGWGAALAGGEEKPTRRRKRAQAG